MPQVRNSPSGELVFIPGNTIVADLASLAALPDSGDVSDLVWVDSLLCYWHRNRFSLLASDGITVLPAIGGGNWERIVSTTAPDWCSQASWGVDPVLGDDENVGTPASPLATFAELDRRLSVGAIQQSTEVALPAGAVLPDSKVSVQLPVATAGVTFTIRGTPTTVIDGTIASYVDRNHATGVGTQITSAAVPDWTAFEGMRIRITSGAATGAIAWIGKANPAGVGVATARTSRFATYVEATGVATAVAVPVGSDFVIESLPEVTSLHVYAQPKEGSTTSAPFRIYNIKTANILLYGDSSLAGPNVDGCCFGAVGGIANSKLESLGTPNSSISVSRCCNTAGLLISGPTVASFHLAKSGINTRTYGGFFRFSSLTSTGAATGLMPGSASPCLYSLIDVQVFDATTAALNPIAGCIINSSSGLSGTGNVIGLLMGSTSASARTADIHFGWMTTADKPTLAGTTAAIRVAGSTNIDLTWAQVPFKDDEQHGVGTLVNGTATIAARNALLRGVNVSKATPIGNPQGNLTVPTATRTAAQFVVNAADAAGALVATDVSTFDWHIPGMFRNVTICQLDSNA